MKDEKQILDKEKITLIKQIEEKKTQIDSLDTSFRKYKKEIEDSPHSLLRAEINKKILEGEEINREKEILNFEKDRYKAQYEKLKMDLIKMKKIMDQERESAYKQKMTEIEKLRFEIYNQNMNNTDLKELQELRNKLRSFKTDADEKKSDIL